MLWEPVFTGERDTLGARVPSTGRGLHREGVTRGRGDTGSQVG